MKTRKYTVTNLENKSLAQRLNALQAVARRATLTKETANFFENTRINDPVFKSMSLSDAVNCILIDWCAKHSRKAIND